MRRRSLPLALGILLGLAGTAGAHSLGAGLGQNLAGRHALAQFGLALGQLARHPKAQPRLHTGPHLGSKLMLGRHAGLAHRHHLHGTHRLLWRRWPRTTREQRKPQRGAQDKNGAPAAGGGGKPGRWMGHGQQQEIKEHKNEVQGPRSIF